MKVVKRRKTGKTKDISLSPIPRSAIRSLLQSTTGGNIQISESAVERLRDLLTEHGKWITMEAEKITKYAGRSTITDKEIRDAVAAYFGSLKRG